jgi:hypothetical protein
MYKGVTFKQLQKTLSGFGFIESQAEDNNVLFRHTTTGVVLTVPNSGTVRPIYVSSAARQLSNSGIATISKFESQLEKAARNG